MGAEPSPTVPMVVAAEMGYGHMRPATALAEALGTSVHACDRPPLAGEEEAALWRRARGFYEWATRLSSVPVVGAPLRPVVQRMTEIARLHPYRDQSRPTWPVRRLEAAIDGGLARGMLAALSRAPRPLLTTYFAPAIAADRAGHEPIHLVVTDADIHRVWVPRDPRTSAITYYTPSTRAARRLRAYGVPAARVVDTGYPLPPSLLGPGLATLKANLARRLVRLDPTHAFRRGCEAELAAFLGPLPEDEAGQPPHLVYAVGGAGAQADLPARFLPGLEDAIARGALRVTLVAGIRPEVRDVLEGTVRRLGLDGAQGPHGVSVLWRESLPAYFQAFDALLADTDILWTKPSELTFFGALGLGLVLGKPIGNHERYNRRWAREQGAALKQRDPRFAGQWLREWLDDGVLAATAWSGCLRLPKFGLERILDHALPAPRAPRGEILRRG